MYHGALLMLFLVLGLPASAMASQIAGSAPYYVNTTTPPSITAPISITRSSQLQYPTNIIPSSSLQSPDNATLSSSNATSITHHNVSCTVNIPSANVYWWFAATYELVIGTMTTKAPGFVNPGGYLTMIPNNATFDAAATISGQRALTETSTWDSEWEMYWTFFDPYPVTPTAAVSSIVTRNTPAPLPSGNIIPQKDWPLYTHDPAHQLPASVSIASIANSTLAITSATPFVRLASYEVVSTVDGAMFTSTVKLSQPSAFDYAVDGVESSASAQGIVPSAFMQDIAQTSCKPGVIYATVTVLIVIDISYVNVPRFLPLLVHLESSASGFESDSPVNIQATSKGVPFTVSWDFPSSGGIGRGAGGEPSTHLPDPQSASEAHASSPGAQNPVPATVSATDRLAGDSFVGGLQPTPHTVGLIGKSPVIVAPSSVVIIGTNTLSPGSIMSVDGTAISLLPSATALAIGDITSRLPLMANPGSSTISVGNILGNPIMLNPSSEIVIAGQTLLPGAPSLTLGGNPISLAPSATALIIRDKTSALPSVLFPGVNAQAHTAAIPLLTIGSSVYTANAATQYYLGPGQILEPGGTAVGFRGTMVSLAPSASFVVIGDQTQALPTFMPASPTARQEIIVAGSTITAISSIVAQNSNPEKQDGQAAKPVFVIGGQTLAPGHDVTVAGTTISLGDSGSVVVINGITSTFPANAAPSTAPPLTVGQRVLEPVLNEKIIYDIHGIPLTPGGLVTVSGAVISLSPDATTLAVDGVTTTISHSQAITIVSGVYSAVSRPETLYKIGNQVLTPGGSIIMEGTTISLAPMATALVVNGVTTSLTTPSKSQPAPTNPPILTIGTQTYTAMTGIGTTFMIGGQVLTPGGAITQNGTTISLAPGATKLVYGSAGKSITEILFPATTTRGSGAQVSTGGDATAGKTQNIGQATATSTTRSFAQSRLAPCLRLLLFSFTAALIGIIA
ncbi:unnamed protein product [Periconia digitata]|uniref:Uncharacterized protein n=1 Tax=Periconia digitata TaxID=1303443 RepID=A0A9W4XXC8_9PLEO|nr:unnamed protein product [Periconia digitata]